MAIKTANPQLHKRMTAAAATIGRGVRYDNDTMELEGRRESALAHIENQILLGRQYLAPQDITFLAKLLHQLDDEASAPDHLPAFPDTNDHSELAHDEPALDEEDGWEEEEEEEEEFEDDYEL